MVRSIRIAARGRDSAARVAGILAVFLAASCATAETLGDGTTTRIRARGEAMRSAEPDRVRVSLGMRSEARNAEAAVRANAERVAAVRAALLKAFSERATVTGAGYALNPRYKYTKGGGRELEHYAVVSRIDVALDDVDQAGRVVDVATDAGANEIQSVQFQLSDDSALRADALRQATVSARAKAEAIAASLGLRILRITSVVEGGADVRPLAEGVGLRVASAMGDAPTQIAASSVRVHARIEMEVEAGQ